MRESTATTTRRSPVRSSPVRTRNGGGPPGRRRVELPDQEFATRGATALAPAATAPSAASAPSAAGEPSAGTERSRLRVAPPVPVSAPKAPFVALVLVVVVAGVLGILVLNTKINENAFRLAHLQRQQTGLDEREQQLNQQLADVSSPTNVAGMAHGLGLVDPGPPTFLTLPNGAVVGVPQPAARH